MDEALIGILAVSGALTVACWVVLWRSTDRVAAKMFWALIAAVPAVGPVLFAALHDPPPIQPEIDQAQGTRDAFVGASRSGAPGHHL